MSNFIDYDEIDFTRRFVFGTSNPSTTDYNQHIRAPGSRPEPIVLNMSSYLTNGGGRYAYPSVFGVVDKFFRTNIPDGIYEIVTDGNITLTDISNSNNTIIELEENDFLIKISQYGTDPLTSDISTSRY